MQHVSRALVSKIIKAGEDGDRTTICKMWQAAGTMRSHAGLWMCAVLVVTPGTAGAMVVILLLLWCPWGAAAPNFAKC